MPGLSGFGLAREVLALRPDVPVLMTSGYLTPQDEKTARQIGIRELILKPETVERLRHSLDRLFENRDNPQQ